MRNVVCMTEICHAFVRNQRIPAARSLLLGHRSATDQYQSGKLVAQNYAFVLNEEFGGVQSVAPRGTLYVKSVRPKFRTSYPRIYFQRKSLSDSNKQRIIQAGT